MMKGGKGKLVTHPESVCGRPVMERKGLNSIAPTSTKREKQLILTVSDRAEIILSLLSRSLTSAMNRAPKAPIAPASEGAKIPR